MILFHVANLAYLLKHDTVYGRYEKEISHTNDSFTIDGNTIKV